MQRMPAVLLLPFWVQDTLNKNNYTLNDIKKFNIAHQLFTLEELIVIYRLQAPNIFDTYFGVSEYESVNPPTEDSLFMSWIATSQTPELHTVYNQILSLKDNQEFVKKLLDNNVFRGRSKQDTPFAVVSDRTETVAVLIYPGFTDEVVNRLKAQYRYAAFKAVVTQLYAHVPHHVVHASSWFLHYVREIEKNISHHAVIN